MWLAWRFWGRRVGAHSRESRPEMSTSRDCPAENTGHLLRRQVAEFPPAPFPSVFECRFPAAILISPVPGRGTRCLGYHRLAFR